jgi:hypothetical protein
MNGGYRMILLPEHPRADANGYVREHIVIAEHALGYSLPPRAEVHHVNETRADNRNCNLVLCEDRSYHMLLHRRKRAFETGCPATWLKCAYCKTYDDPVNLYIGPRGMRGKKYHRACAAQKMRESYRNRNKQKCQTF